MRPKSNKSNSKEELDQIAQATVDLLQPRFDLLESLISERVQTVDLDRAKLNILDEHYRMDNIDQYKRRENIRI